MLSFTNCEGVSSHFRIPNRPISYWTDHRPAYLGNSFTCIQYRMCYTCPGPFFQCEFNCDVNLVIELTKLVHMYEHSAPIFNVDAAVVSVW